VHFWTYLAFLTRVAAEKLNITSQLNLPALKVQLDSHRKIYHKHKSPRNSKQPARTKAKPSYSGAMHVRKYTFNLNTELRTWRRRQSVGCLQTVVELNFGKQKIKLAARGQNGI